MGEGWGGGGRQHILKRITVLFENSILKTPKINAITQVSQGILSTIVDRHLDRQCFAVKKSQSKVQKYRLFSSNGKIICLLQCQKVW